MTFSTSEVAVCCSSVSVSSCVRCCSSSIRRMFSIAITAWSAKVLTSSICFSVNGRGRRPRHREDANRKALSHQRYSAVLHDYQHRAGCRALFTRGRPRNPEYELFVVQPEAADAGFATGPD